MEVKGKPTAGPANEKIGGRGLPAAVELPGNAKRGKELVAEDAMAVEEAHISAAALIVPRACEVPQRPVILNSQCALLLGGQCNGPPACA